jgi:hypothetical protein
MHACEELLTHAELTINLLRVSNTYPASRSMGPHGFYIGPALAPSTLPPLHGFCPQNLQDTSTDTLSWHPKSLVLCSRSRHSLRQRSRNGTPKTAQDQAFYHNNSTLRVDGMHQKHAALPVQDRTIAMTSTLVKNR